MNNIEIYLTNKRKLDEGMLVGDWFEINENFDLGDALLRIGVDGMDCTTYCITAYECDFMEIDENHDIDELIRIKEEMEER